MNANQPIHSISLNTAAVLTGRSIRTWQRRIEEGLVPRLNDARARALVPFDAVQAALAVELNDEDVQTLVRADRGNATAQAEIGALFSLAALNDPQSGGVMSAFYFLTMAAELGEADAMHWLSILHAAGLGKDGDDCAALALMWVAKAAAHGHVIAQQQVAALISVSQKVNR
jgi:hypothetical protein